MNSVSLLQVLEKTVSVDKKELELAHQYLTQALQSNRTEYIKALSDVLSNPGNNPIARTAAGLIIKNIFTSKEEALKEQYQQRWLSFPETTRCYIKENILKSIGTETSRPSTVAQCLAFIATIELALNKWPELIKILCTNIISSPFNPVKETSLEVICYICQEMKPEFLASHYSDSILTAIVHGMRKEVANRYVKLAATIALLNSLKIIKANFEKQNERNYLMEVVCETTQYPDTQIRVVALQCLARIMSLYYYYMEPYMAQALFPITLEAIKSDIDEIALQGIEFWSCVSTEEIDISIESLEAIDLGELPQRTSRFYTKGALKYLIPVLLQKQTKIEENEDEDECTPREAASACLIQLASCCGDDVVQFVIPFVRENITNANWRYRDASLSAFASILSGIKEMTLNILIGATLPTVIELMHDSSGVVRYSASWTIYRICDCAPEVAINETYLKVLLEAMVNGLQAEPRIANNVCLAISSLAEASFDALGAESPYTYCLSPYFDSIVEKLLETTLRNDADHTNLRSTAYEALTDMIKNSAHDCYATIQQTTIVIVERLQQQNMLSLSGSDSGNNELQGLLCATLQCVLTKVLTEDAPKISDQIMGALLQMLSSDSNRYDSVHEDALQAVSTLIDLLGQGFLKYMDTFKQFLLHGLKNHAAYQVCISAMYVIGSLCHALKKSFVPYCDEIMTVLLENLKDQSAHPVIKPETLSIIGEIVLYIGSDFRKYLEAVLTTLVYVSQLEIDRKDCIMLEHLNGFRESILKTYSSIIIHGLIKDNTDSNPDLSMVETHVSFMLGFIARVGVDNSINDDVICACAGLTGDICNIFGSKILPNVNIQVTNNILQLARKSRIVKTRHVGQWATKELRKIFKNSDYRLINGSF